MILIPQHFFLEYLISNYTLLVNRRTDRVKNVQVRDRTRNLWDSARSAQLFKLQGQFPAWHSQSKLPQRIINLCSEYVRNNKENAYISVSTDLSRCPLEYLRMLHCPFSQKFLSQLIEYLLISQ